MVKITSILLSLFCRYYVQTFVMFRVPYTQFVPKMKKIVIDFASVE